VVDLAAWLANAGLERYAALFEEQRIGADVLADLSDSDLEKLGIPLGDRKRLLRAIAALGDPNAETAGPLPSHGARPAEAAERRHLTVLFCDLVGSTELAGRLDPEELRALVGRFQRACEAEIRGFDGFVARYMGDGLLAYFGYPRAHEDDAERAIRAGLGIVGAVATLLPAGGGDGASKLAVRVGIATGRVVAGDLVGQGPAEERTVVGQTPNLAARLQALADPGTVVVGPETRRIVGDVFQWQDLGRQALKGFLEPVQVWRAVEAKAAETRFEARHGTLLTPLVGREEEIDLLLRRWRSAKDGEGQVVLLAGEPGVGKSRLTQALRDRIAGDPQLRVRYQCSPYFARTALYPFIEQLSWAAGFARTDGPEQRLDKMEAMLGLAMTDVTAIAPLFASLFSIPAGGRYPPLELAPEQWKERMFEAILRQMEGLVAHQPLLVVFEDVHWIDPTSLEFLDHVIDRLQSLPILSVITFRPEFVPPWVGQPHVALLTLNRMGRRECSALVAEVPGGNLLPGPVVDQIVAKSDGVPLFVEELTKAVLESGWMREVAHGDKPTGPLPPLAIPASLQDSLMARLDRMPAVKEVAQTAAAIGREFSYELIAAVSPISESALRDALAELAKSEIIFQRGTPPDARYLFKHALVRDAAYESLLKSRRQQFHAGIADVLDAQFPETAEREPELLAHHFTEAGLAERAIEYWRRAGDRAAERSANREAISNFGRGLELLRTLSESGDRDRWELSLRMGIGPCLVPIKGFASPEVVANYRRARELYDQVGESSQQFPVIWGLWHSLNSSGRLDEAAALAHELISIAEQQENAGLLLQARHSAWTSHFARGELKVALENARTGKTLYDPDHHGTHAFFYGGHDAGVCCRFMGAMALAVLGFPNQAREWARESVDLAERLGHPFSLAMARSFATSVYFLRREAHAVQTHAAELSEFCRERGFAQYLAMTTLLKGWGLAAEGNAPSGIVLIQEGVDAVRATGFRRLAFQMALLAEACLWNGEIERGLAAVSDAEEAIDETGEHLWESEILRLKGQLFLARASAETVAAACLHQAVSVACRQDAKWFELRAATSLARLMAERGQWTDARRTLAPVYNWFTEGFDTADLRQAKALLQDPRMGSFRRPAAG
jgi:class 3 adenylate cyclase